MLNLKVGKSKRLEFEVYPEGFYYDKVKWESSNEKVAKVNYQGRIDAVGLGQAEITATLKGGVDDMIAKCLVIVDETDNFIFKGDKIRLPKINDVYPVVARRSKIRTVFGGYY